VSIKTQETCKPVPPRWTTAKIQAEKRVRVLCVNPAICAVCAVLAGRSFNNLRWHNRGRGFESHPLRQPIFLLFNDIKPFDFSRTFGVPFVSAARPVPRQRFRKPQGWGSVTP